jgi:hypothetical protein
MGLESTLAGDVELSVDMRRDENDAGLPGFAARGLKEPIELSSANDDAPRRTDDDDGLNAERNGEAGQKELGSDRSGPPARMELMQPLLSSLLGSGKLSLMLGSFLQSGKNLRAACGVYSVRYMEDRCCNQIPTQAQTRRIQIRANM